MSIETTHVFVMARGLGTRLLPLTQDTCKPCVAFGEYRIIDFVLSNLQQAGFPSQSITVLGPPEELGLTAYLENHWPLVNVKSITAAQPLAGNAKSVLQALQINLDNQAKHIGVFASDQIFHFDIKDSFDQYIQGNTNAVFLAKWHPVKEASRFGIFHVKDHRAVKLLEKPKHIPSELISNEQSLINMGMYWFKRDNLIETLLRDSEIETSSNDFGHDILPMWINEHQTVLYEVNSDLPWEDVGTIDHYWMTYWTYHREIQHWNIRKPKDNHPKTIDKSAHLHKCILFDNVDIGKNCSLSNLIISEGCIIEENITISLDTEIKGLMYQARYCLVIPPRCRVRYDKGSQTIISEPL